MWSTVWKRFLIITNIFLVSLHEVNEYVHVYVHVFYFEATNGTNSMFAWGTKCDFFVAIFVTIFDFLLCFCLCLVFPEMLTRLTLRSEERKSCSQHDLR